MSVSQIIKFIFQTSGSTAVHLPFHFSVAFLANTR